MEQASGSLSNLMSSLTFQTGLHDSGWPSVLGQKEAFLSHWASNYNDNGIGKGYLGTKTRTKLISTVSNQEIGLTTFVHIYTDTSTA
jgi:hypothetical protein